MKRQVPEIFSSYKNTRSNTIGKNGVIKIDLESNSNFKTYIKSLQSKAPFLIQRAIFPDAMFPNLAHVYMMSSSGGVLDGDELDIDIIAGPRASAKITTQSATKIYKMENGYASQYVNIHCKNGSYLEYVPHQIIPFRSSRFYQQVDLHVEDNSTLIYSEIISSGRIAYGEKFDFDLYFLRTSAYKNGQILFSDVMNMNNSNKSIMESIFDGKNHLSTIYVINSELEQEKTDEKIFSLIHDSSMLAGCSTLPNESGLIVRILSDSVDEIVALTENITKILRQANLSDKKLLEKIN